MSHMHRLTGVAIRRFCACLVGCCLLVIGAMPSQAVGCTLQHIVVKATSDTPLLSWSDATAATEGTSINVRVTPGSYVSASVMLKASGEQTCQDIIASPTNATASGMSPLSAGNIDIRYVKRWYQAGAAWTEISPKGPRKLVPELLLKDSQLVKSQAAGQRNFLRLIRNDKATYVDVSQSGFLTDGALIPANAEFYVRDADDLQPFDVTTDPVQLWLSIDIPADTVAGTYAGAIDVKAGQQQVLRIPMQIRVLPFTLPKPALEYSIFYRSQLAREGTVSSEYRNEQQHRAELRDLKRHGIDNPNIYQEFGNTTLLQQALKIRREEGFNEPRAYFLGLSAASGIDAASRKTLSSNVAQLKSLLAANGYTDPYVFAIDESVGAAQKEQTLSWKTVQDAGARVFATGRTGTYANVGPALDALILAFEPDAAEIRQFHAAGKRVLTYAFPQSGPENPALFRRNYGIRLWASDVDGAMPYAYMHSFGSGWNDFDHAEYRDHHFVYPTVNGIVPTLAWEGFHAAVEDVRYLTALQLAVQNAAQHMRCGTNPCEEVQAAKTYLDQIRQTGGNADPDKVRNVAIDHILTLMAPSPPSMFVSPITKSSP